MTTATNQQVDQERINGLDKTAMFGTLEAIKSDPEIAHFEFRAKNQWISGGENRSTIKGFYGARSEDDSRVEPFMFTNGEPPVLLGNNEGANPVEFLLHALAGCVTTTAVIHAAARGITIHRLSTELAGTIDVQGLLALDDSVPVGYQEITIRMHLEADCSDDQIDELIAVAQQRSPVWNTITRAVPVRVERVS